MRMYVLYDRSKGTSPSKNRKIDDREKKIISFVVNVSVVFPL